MPATFCTSSPGCVVRHYLMICTRPAFPASIMDINHRHASRVVPSRDTQVLILRAASAAHSGAFNNRLPALGHSMSFLFPSLCARAQQQAATCYTHLVAWLAARCIKDLADGACCSGWFCRVEEEEENRLSSSSCQEINVAAQQRLRRIMPQVVLNFHQSFMSRRTAPAACLVILYSPCARCRARWPAPTPPGTGAPGRSGRRR